MSTGWTWDYIAHNMDIPRLVALNEYWSTNPPVHIMIKAFLGIGQKDKEGDMSELMAMIPESSGVVM